MNILLTGAAGFIGSHLTDKLISNGHSVIGVDNFSTGKAENISHLFSNASFSFLEADCIEPLDIKNDIDWILHFASPASPIDYMQKPFLTLKVGSIAVFNLLDLAREKKAGFFLASTSEIYGDPLVHPQEENYWGNVNPTGPRSVYDESKRFAEAVSFAYKRYYKTKIKIIRIFNTFGPRMQINDGRVVPNFIMQALANKPLTIYGDGLQTRSFCYVSDMVEAITRFLNVEDTGPVNLGNDEEMTILDFARQINELTGNKSEMVFTPLPRDDPKKRKPVLGRAKELLDWQPVIGLKEGLTKTIEYFKKEYEKNSNH
ncbi:MAG: SDR family oxidoreductase [Candidatus Coatesbacteria bacterium]|nr:SDR family oxidoreductase [Candidatus Coatesbacteria bacterium]